MHESDAELRLFQKLSGRLLSNGFNDRRDTDSQERYLTFGKCQTSWELISKKKKKDPAACRKHGFYFNANERNSVGVSLETLHFAQFRFRL